MLRGIRFYLISTKFGLASQCWGGIALLHPLDLLLISRDLGVLHQIRYFITESYWFSDLVLN